MEAEPVRNASTDPSRLQRIISLHNQRAPRVSGARLLTQVEALREFPGLRIPQRLYALVEAGDVHAVRVGKRWRYPDWEIAAALRAAIRAAREAELAA